MLPIYFRRRSNPGRIAAVLLSVLICSVCQGADFTLDSLMHTLSLHDSGHALFSETKTLADLERPIKSSGELRFQKPDYLEMRTLKPRLQTVILHGDELKIRTRRTRRRIDLDDHPDVALLINSIRATLNGDGSALRRDFGVRLAGNRAQWTLTLVPTNTKARARVSRILISGQRDQVHGIEVDHADGDRSQMTIHPLRNS